MEDDEMPEVTFICQWNDLCRLCLRSEQPLRNVFFDEPLLENVREVTSLCVNADDPLPPSVCQVCVDQVNSFVEFRQQCRATDAWLRHEAYVSAADQEKDIKQEKHEMMSPTDLLIEPDQYEEELIDDPAPINDSVENEIELSHCIIQSEEVLSMSVSEESLHENSGVHKCTICNKEFSSTCSLSNHMRSHSGERPFGCSVCEKFFKTKSNLNEHYRVHNPQLRWMKTSSKNLPSLTRVTVTPEDVLSCGQCDLAFESPDDLFNHESSHSEERLELSVSELKQEIEEQWPEHCQLAPATSDARPSLALTEIKCQEIVPLVIDNSSRNCPYCGKLFRSLATLENHKRVHTREKPFACEVCAKPFRTKGNLLEHKRVHDNSLWLMKSDTKLAIDTAASQLANSSSQQQYQCTYCKKPFRTHTAQLNHERVHTREKPFGCGMCDKCFRTKSNLNEHIKGCHNIEWSSACKHDVEVFTFKSHSVASSDNNSQRRSVL